MICTWHREYKPEYERLKKEKLAEVAAEQQKQLDRLRKDVAQGEGETCIPINTGGEQMRFNSGSLRPTLK